MFRGMRAVKKSTAVAAILALAASVAAVAALMGSYGMFTTDPTFGSNGTETTPVSGAFVGGTDADDWFGPQRPNAVVVASGPATDAVGAPQYVFSAGGPVEDTSDFSTDTPHAVLTRVNGDGTGNVQQSLDTMSTPLAMTVAQPDAAPEQEAYIIGQPSEDSDDTDPVLYSASAAAISDAAPVVSDDNQDATLDPPDDYWCPAGASDAALQNDGAPVVLFSDCLYFPDPDPGPGSPQAAKAKVYKRMKHAVASGRCTAAMGSCVREICGEACFSDSVVVQYVPGTTDIDASADVLDKRGDSENSMDGDKVGVDDSGHVYVLGESEDEMEFSFPPSTTGKRVKATYARSKRETPDSGDEEGLVDRFTYSPAHPDGSADSGLELDGTAPAEDANLDAPLLGVGGDGTVAYSAVQPSDGSSPGENDLDTPSSPTASYGVGRLDSDGNQDGNFTVAPKNGSTAIDTLQGLLPVEDSDGQEVIASGSDGDGGYAVTLLDASGDNVGKEDKSFGDGGVYDMKGQGLNTGPPKLQSDGKILQPFLGTPSASDTGTTSSGTTSTSGGTTTIDTTTETTVTTGTTGTTTGTFVSPCVPFFVGTTVYGCPTPKLKTRAKGRAATTAAATAQQAPVIGVTRFAAPASTTPTGSTVSTGMTVTTMPSSPGSGGSPSSGGGSPGGGGSSPVTTATTATTTTGTTTATPTTTGGGGSGGTTTTVTSTPVNSTATSTPAGSTPPPAGGTSTTSKPPVVKGASATSCLSRRAFTIHLRPHISHRSHLTIDSVHVTIAGKPIHVSMGKRYTARINLKTLPFGKFTIKVSIQRSDGKTVHDDRHYRTCRIGKTDRPAPNSSH